MNKYLVNNKISNDTDNFFQKIIKNKITLNKDRWKTVNIASYIRKA